MAWKHEYGPHRTVDTLVHKTKCDKQTYSTSVFAKKKKKVIDNIPCVEVASEKADYCCFDFGNIPEHYFGSSCTFLSVEHNVIRPIHSSFFFN